MRLIVILIGISTALSFTTFEISSAVIDIALQDDFNNSFIDNKCISFHSMEESQQHWTALALSVKLIELFNIGVAIRFMPSNICFELSASSILPKVRFGRLYKSQLARQINGYIINEESDPKNELHDNVIWDPYEEMIRILRPQLLSLPYPPTLYKRRSAIYFFTHMPEFMEIIGPDLLNRFTVPLHPAIISKELFDSAINQYETFPELKTIEKTIDVNIKRYSLSKLLRDADYTAWKRPSALASRRISLVTTKNPKRSSEETPINSKKGCASTSLKSSIVKLEEIENNIVLVPSLKTSIVVNTKGEKLIKMRPYSYRSSIRFSGNIQANLDKDVSIGEGKTTSNNSFRRSGINEDSVEHVNETLGHSIGSLATLKGLPNKNPFITNSSENHTAPTFNEGILFLTPENHLLLESPQLPDRSGLSFNGEMQEGNTNGSFLSAELSFLNRQSFVRRAPNLATPITGTGDIPENYDEGETRIIVFPGNYERVNDSNILDPPRGDGTTIAYDSVRRAYDFSLQDENAPSNAEINASFDGSTPPTTPFDLLLGMPPIVSESMQMSSEEYNNSSAHYRNSGAVDVIKENPINYLSNNNISPRFPNSERSILLAPNDQSSVESHEDKRDQCEDDNSRLSESFKQMITDHKLNNRSLKDLSFPQEDSDYQYMSSRIKSVTSLAQESLSPQKIKPNFRISRMNLALRGANKCLLMQGKVQKMCFSRKVKLESSLDEAPLYKENRKIGIEINTRKKTGILLSSNLLTSVDANALESMSENTVKRSHSHFLPSTITTSVLSSSNIEKDSKYSKRHKVFFDLNKALKKIVKGARAIVVRSFLNNVIRSIIPKALLSPYFSEKNSVVNKEYIRVPYTLPLSSSTINAVFKLNQSALYYSLDYSAIANISKEAVEETRSKSSKVIFLIMYYTVRFLEAVASQEGFIMNRFLDNTNKNILFHWFPNANNGVPSFQTYNFILSRNGELERRRANPCDVLANTEICGVLHRMRMALALVNPPPYTQENRKLLKNYEAYRVRQSEKLNEIKNEITSVITSSYQSAVNHYHRNIKEYQMYIFEDPSYNYSLLNKVDVELLRRSGKELSDLTEDEVLLSARLLMKQSFNYRKGLMDLRAVTEFETVLGYEISTLVKHDSAWSTTMVRVDNQDGFLHVSEVLRDVIIETAKIHMGDALGFIFRVILPYVRFSKQEGFDPERYQRNNGIEVYERDVLDKVNELASQYRHQEPAIAMKYYAIGSALLNR